MGGRIVITTEEFAAQIWPVSDAVLQQTLRDSSNYCLTAEQRQTYLSESDVAARTGHEACEFSQGRIPIRVDATASPFAATH